MRRAEKTPEWRDEHGSLKLQIAVRRGGLGYLGSTTHLAAQVETPAPAGCDGFTERESRRLAGGVGGRENRRGEMAVDRGGGDELQAANKTHLLIVYDFEMIKL